MANEQKRPPPFVQYEQRQQYVCTFRVSYTSYKYFDVQGMYHIGLEVNFNLQKNSSIILS